MNTPFDFNVDQHAKQKILASLAAKQQQCDPDDYHTRGRSMLAMLPQHRSGAIHEWEDTLTNVANLQEAIRMVQQGIHAGNSIYMVETIKIMAAKIDQELSNLSDYARHIAETEVFAVGQRAYLLRKDNTLADFSLNLISEYTDPNEESYDLERK